MEAILIGSMVAGTVMSAVSAIQQGQYAAAMGEQQAQIAAQQAEAQRLAGEIEAREKRKEGREAVEKGRAMIAAGGVVPGTGTPGLLAQETAAEYERDARLIQSGYGQQAELSLARGRYSKAYGESQRRASLWSAGTSIATGAAGLAGMYYRPKPEPFFKTQLRYALKR